MPVSIEFSGGFSTRSIAAHIEGLETNTRRGMRRALYMIGKDLRKTINDDIKNKEIKTGKIYIIRTAKTRRRHRASAPGETAANISGTYRRGIFFEVRSDTSLEFGGSAEHTKWLELGTKNKQGVTIMKPRPGLENTMKKRLKNGASSIIDEINKAVKDL